MLRLVISSILLAAFSVNVTTTAEPAPNSADWISPSLAMTYRDRQKVHASVRMGPGAPLAPQSTTKRNATVARWGASWAVAAASDSKSLA
ncbi:MAG TPA: hypothetical protein VEV17_06400 [Bryobacteraceae bacterium]|nr:hypothetical protein [Bryobacteraceae bacterium]